MTMGMLSRLATCVGATLTPDSCACCAAGFVAKGVVCSRIVVAVADSAAASGNIPVPPVDFSGYVGLGGIFSMDPLASLSVVLPSFCFTALSTSLAEVGAGNSSLPSKIRILRRFRLSFLVAPDADVRCRERLLFNLSSSFQRPASCSSRRVSYGERRAGLTLDHG